jgi:hypothetical protein
MMFSCIERPQTASCNTRPEAIIVYPHTKAEAIVVSPEFLAAYLSFAAFVSFVWAKPMCMSQQSVFISPYSFALAVKVAPVRRIVDVTGESRMDFKMCKHATSQKLKGIVLGANITIPRQEGCTRDEPLKLMLRDGIQ